MDNGQWTMDNGQWIMDNGGAFQRTECSRKAHGCSHRLVQVTARSDWTPQKTEMAKGGQWTMDNSSIIIRHSSIIIRHSSIVNYHSSFFPLPSSLFLLHFATGDLSSFVIRHSSFVICPHGFPHHHPSPSRPPLSSRAQHHTRHR